MTPPLLVLDKSFAHAVKAARLASLSSDYTILVPSAFIYEVFDTELEKRKHTVTGLGEFRQIDIPQLLWQEQETGSPASPDLYRNAPRLNFNSMRSETGWTLLADETPIISSYAKMEVNPKIDFWESVTGEGVIGFDTEELLSVRGCEANFRQLCGRLRDRDYVRAIAAKMGHRHVGLIDETWLTFRRLQALLLNGLIMQHHYPPGQKPRKRVDLEHDVHDIEYLSLGLHVGGLATGETSEKKHTMGWRFRLLAPNSLLMTP